MCEKLRGNEWLLLQLRGQTGIAESLPNIGYLLNPLIDLPFNGALFSISTSFWLALWAFDTSHIS